MCFKKKIRCPKCGEKTPKDEEICVKCGVVIKEASAIKKKKEEMDYVTDDIIKHRGFFGRVIPQYRGYKKRELRRVSDKLVRDYLVKILKGSKDALKTMQSNIIEKSPEVVKKIEDLLTDVDIFSRKIQHADYGYMETGTKALRIGEEELDKLLDFDKNAIETVMDIDFDVKELTEDSLTLENIKILGKKVRAATDAYEQRDEYMRGFS